MKLAEARAFAKGQGVDNDQEAVMTVLAHAPMMWDYPQIDLELDELFAEAVKEGVLVKREDGVYVYPEGR